MLGAKFFKQIILGFVLGFYGISSQLYAGCWDQCIMVNPVTGKCVRTKQWCNPGDDPLGQVGDGISSLLSDTKKLNDKIIQNILKTAPKIDISVLQSGIAKIKFPKDYSTLGLCAVSVGFTVANGVICAGSDGTSPGAGNPETFTTGNACGDAAASGVFAVGICFGGIEPNKQKDVASVIQSDNIASWINNNPKIFEAKMEEINTKINAGATFNELFHVGDEVSKRGNNGTVSCNTFTSNPRWGGIKNVGLCTAAKRSDTGEWVNCSHMGTVDLAELICYYSPSMNKNGNNGTVSCNTFCNQSRWGGFSGECIYGWDNIKKEPISCESGNYTHPGNYTCACASYE